MNPDDPADEANPVQLALDGYLTTLGSIDERLGKAAVGSMKKFEDTLVSGLKNGKLEFKAFADFAIEQLLRIAIQEVIVKRLTNTFGSFFSAFGSPSKDKISSNGGGGYDGGGFTGAGIRAGGVDGKGGFPAILHPNETVVDIALNIIGGTSTVNFNISTVDAAGFDQLLASRKGMITSIINQAMNSRGKIGVV